MGAATFLKAVFRVLLVLPWSGSAFLRGETLDLFDPAMAALHVAYLDGGIVFGAATLCWLVGVAGRQVVVWLGRSVDAALVDLSLRDVRVYGAVSVFVVLRWRMRFSLPRVVPRLAHSVMAEARGSAEFVSVELCPSVMSAAFGVAM
jgi:hypothetical protein